MNMPTMDRYDDPALLAEASRGDRDAYGHLVSRHQAAVASIAYSVCGEFTTSEDIAQEAFVAAWRQLRELEDRTKFRAWVCGIARNLALSHVRQRDRRRVHVEPATSGAEEYRDDSAGPREHAVSREEATAVWRSLETLPDMYREPLILFYREHQSVERVAAALDLTVDTAKQRLARGRALLRADLEKTIERTLGFTTPGALFATTVVSMLPAAGTAAVVASGGAATAKTSALPKLALLMPVAAAPVIGLVAMLIGRRQALRLARSEADRRLVKRMWFALGSIVVVGQLGFAFLFWRIQAQPRQEQFHTLMLAWCSLTLVGLGVLSWTMRKPFITFARNARLPDDATPRQRRWWFGVDRAVAYRSSVSLFGLPLVDVRFGHSADCPMVRGTARGWVAVGDIAQGVLFALGGEATGAVALGVIAIGPIAVGAITLGGFACGFVAAGAVASGGVAIGYLAFGTFVGLGYEAAQGIVAIARHIAQGMLFSSAEHVHDMIVVDWDRTNYWALRLRRPIFTPWTAILIPTLSIVGTNWLARDRHKR